MSDDWLEKYEKRKIENGIRDGYFSQESQIFCPYCGHIQNDAHEALPRHQEDWVNYECEKCEKNFRMCFECVYRTERWRRE